jgi:hypothetical protein
MHSGRATWRRLAVALLAAALTPAALPAAPARAKERPPTPAEKVRKDLDQTLSIEIVEQPLELALNQLREQARLNIVLDRLTLAQNNIDPNSAPANNVKLKDVKAKAALRALLSPFNLNYAVIGDTVLVSTEEMLVYRQLKQRVNVDVDKVELTAALKGLARETATNLVVDARVAKDAQTPVTLQVEDVPLETAVRLLAEMAGLKPVRVGNTLFVTAKANAVALRGEPDLVPNPAPRANGGDVINLVAPGGVGVPVAPPAAGGLPPPAVVPGAPPAPAPPAAPAEGPKKPGEEKEDVAPGKPAPPEKDKLPPPPEDKPKPPEPKPEKK